MKNKFSKILGVGLVIAVLASLLVVSTPASAGNMSWTKDTSPSEVLNKVSGAQIVDMAVASNGTTGYAVDSTGVIYKTTDGGATWLATTGTVTGALKVAVAPDSADGSVLAVITATTVYTSGNGGTSFAAASAVPGVSTLNSINISKAVNGARSLLVTGNTTAAAAGVWYFATSGDVYGGGTGWQNILDNAVWPGATGNVTAGLTSALDAQFSPSFDTDATIAAITTTGSATYANIAHTGLKAWNGAILVFSGWGTGVAIGAGSAKADLALPGSFYGYDAGTRVAYVATGTGLWRVGNTVASQLSTTPMNSVSVNAAGDKLVAGAAGSTLVYRVASPSNALATGVLPSAKSPGGVNNVTARFFGTSVGAATNGTQSAFGLSVDDGANFNDVAFVNDVGAVAKDFAVNADASKYYLSTVSAGGVASLWRKTTTWERVFKYQTTSYYIVRPAMDNFDVIYFAEKGGTVLWISNDAGQATWAGRNVAPVTDLAAESASTLYILSGAAVLKSTNTFNYAPATTLTGTGNDLYLVAKDNLVAASAGGFAYTTDAGTTWTKVAGGNVSYVSATGLATGGVINAAVGASVYQYTIGTSTAFPTLAAATATYPINGLVTASGVTYAISNDGVANSSYLRSKITAAAWSNQAIAGTALADLMAAGGNLYTLATAGTDAGYIFKFTEIFAAAGPAVTGPADKFVVPINMETGAANNVVFQWTGIANANPVTTTYNLQIALDSAFTQVVKDIPGIAGGLAIVGATANGNYQFPFQADTTYYFRIRADAAFDSPWSATPYRSFKIDTLAPVNLISPTSGANNVGVQPTFAWSAAAGATGYEIVVSDDPTFAIITYSRTTTLPVFASDEQLAYSTVYYWRVRPTGPSYPAAGTAYKVGVFTTAARPTTTEPPITITNTTNTITVEIPPSKDVIPAYLLWIIIGIGAILVIALIVLIVRTRRVS